MPTHVALLRGINVGRQSRIAMSDLREVVSSVGHDDVATYIQSGNVVFSTPQTDTKRLAADLERAIVESLGVGPKVIVVSRDELADVVATNPFPEETDPKFLHAVFHGEELSSAALADVAAAQRRAADKGSRDESRVVGRTLFLRTPGGLGRSELAAQLARADTAKAGEAGTARNWATVTKLLSLVEG